MQDTPEYRRMLYLISYLERKGDAECPTVCPILVFHVEFAQSEVAQSDMSSIVKKDVLGFQVAVDDLEAMQALEGAEQLGSIETSTINVESLFSLKVMEQLSTIHKSQNKV